MKFKATSGKYIFKIRHDWVINLFAAKYQELIAMWGLGVGLLTGYLVMIIDFLYLSIRAGKRGELLVETR